MSRCCCASLLLALLVTGACPAGETEAPKASAAAAPSATAKGDGATVEEALVRALDYLEGQQHADGHWENANRTARDWSTAWAVLAFLANGHTARSGTYRDCVAKGLAFIYADVAAAEDGKVSALSLFTLLAALGQGSEQGTDEDLVIVCERHVQALIHSQWRSPPAGAGKGAMNQAFAAGGWGPVTNSYWPTLCLVAAERCGMRVPRVVFDDLRAYWKRHYNVTSGSYYDQLMWDFRSAGADHGATLSIRAVQALCLLGEAEAPEVQGTRDALLDVKIEDPDWIWRAGRPRSYNDGMALLFATWFLSMKMIGTEAHDLRRWRAAYSARILNDQMENGAFRYPGWDCTWRWKKDRPDKQYGAHNWLQFTLGYGVGWSETNLTAHAAFALALPKGYLPCFAVQGGK